MSQPTTADIDNKEVLENNAGLIMKEPSSSFPMTVTLSIEVRQKLLSFLEKAANFIFRRHWRLLFY